MHILQLLTGCLLVAAAHTQITRGIGRFQEVFAWKQITFDIDGTIVQEDRASFPGVSQTRDPVRERRQAGTVFFGNDDDDERNWNQQGHSSTSNNRPRPNSNNPGPNSNNPWPNSNNQWPNSNNQWPNSNNQWPNINNQWPNSNNPSTNKPTRFTTTSERPTTTSQRPTTTSERNRRPTVTESSGQPTSRSTTSPRPGRPTSPSNQQRPTTTTARPGRPTSSSNQQLPTTTTARPSDQAGQFFIQYNNLPMGVERVDDRLFVTLPRRRYGVPSTLNYIQLSANANNRSPPLRPYPSLRAAAELTSVYRTRADSCGRLWMVDTGLLEIPNNPQQIQEPAIVIYDLQTDTMILRHPLQSSDLPSAVTPTGLASITVDVADDCSDAYAYIPDLATYGLIVFSLRSRETWRLSHNYFHFEPTAGNLVIAGQRFQWNDGVFSVALSEPGAGGCRTAFFHPMVGTNEFSVSTCVLRNRTASSDPNFWSLFSVVGDRGMDSHANMHGYHPGTGAVLFASIARDGVACWNTGERLSSSAVGILARDSSRMSYPSDLHITGDEVWVMANSLPTWAYARLDTSQYNFFVYKANVPDLIEGTVCSTRKPQTFSRSGIDDESTANQTMN